MEPEEYQNYPRDAIYLEPSNDDCMSSISIRFHRSKQQLPHQHTGRSQ